jgi:hypothetical protein
MTACPGSERFCRRRSLLVSHRRTQYDRYCPRCYGCLGRFLTFEEITQQLEQERQRADRKSQARQAAVLRLLAMGLTVEQIAEALELPIEAIQTIAQTR